MNPPPIERPAEAGSGPLILSSQQAEAIVRVVESAPHVRRRYQFFVWTQSQLQTLLPHQMLVCGAYQRKRREVVYEAFHSVVVPPVLLEMMTDGDGPLLRAMTAAWIDGRGRPLLVEPARGVGPALAEAGTLLRGAGIETLLVHGMSRPQRPAEIESFFVFATPGRSGLASLPIHAELMLPHLHTTWLRVMAAEREIAPSAPASAAPRKAKAEADPAVRGVTERECQILGWVREGKSNQQIAEILGISPLTVKNHVQKILRKLGASNRAQAVAEAMAQGLLDSNGRR